MKKDIKIYFLLAIMICFCNIALNAQQKQSDKDFTQELNKVNAKRAARYAYISRMRASIPVETPATTPASQNISPDTRTGGQPATATPNQRRQELKPSQQPISIPRKPAVTKQ